MAELVEITGSRQATVQRLGRKGTSTVDVKFHCLGASSDSDAHAICNQFFTANRFYDISGIIFLLESYELTHIGGDCWEVTARYESAGSDDETAPFRRTRAFDTSGGTIHVTQSLESGGERRWGVDGEGAAPSADFAINADETGVRGVDVIAPALQWTETYDVPSVYVTAAYIKNVATLTGTVNNAAFRTFAPGEVLFAGCNGSQQWDSERGDSPWQLSYKFIASPNAGPGQTLPALECGDIKGIAKRGHDYLWVRYDDSISNDDYKAQVKKPKYVYVNKVYRDGDFAGLGIGTT